MNIQPNEPEKPDALGRLFQIWGLTPANKELARAYLTDDQADDSMLSGAKKQFFSPLNGYDQWEVSQLLTEVLAPESSGKQPKILRLLWAIGHSTACFTALFNCPCINDRYTATDSVFDQRCKVLGVPAAAAMDAEYAAAVPTGYVQTERLHRLASTTPNALSKAQKLIADPRNSMADIVITGVLLANTDPAEKEPSLLEKLFGMASTSQWAKVERLLARTDDIVESASGSGLSSADIGNLKCYIHAGDSSAPVPNTQVSTAWQLPEQDIFDSFLTDRSAVKCMTASVMFGLRHDNRLACALQVLAGLNLCDVLQSILNFLPPEWDISFLDTLLPHIPGGAVSLLRFMAKDFAQQDEAVAKKIARRYYENADTALQYCSLDEYTKLCQLLPPAKNKDHDARMEQLRNRISAIYENSFAKGIQQTIVHDYLSRQGNFADSVNLLKPIRNEYRYLSNLQSILNDYKKIAGWDEFACRCIVLSSLTCMGYGTFTSFTSYTLPADEKRNMDAFVNALIAGKLPVRDCITVLAFLLYDNWYQDNAEKLIEEAIQKHFVTPAGLDALADAALNGSSAARILAIKGLNALSADQACAEGARKALILCAADTSKQVQEVLIECFTNHPDTGGSD